MPRFPQRRAPTEPPAEALLDACRGGDQTAWAELDWRYRRRVFGLCYAKTHDSARAEDWTQEIFTRVAQGLVSFVGGDFDAWIFSIARNYVVDQWRRRSRDPLVGAREVGDRGDDQLDPEEQLKLASVEEQVGRVLASLSPKERIAWELRHNDEMRLGQIAERLGLSRRSLERALNSAAGKLLAWFYREYRGPEPTGFRALLNQTQRVAWDLSRRGVSKETIACCVGYSLRALAQELEKLTRRHERYARAQQAAACAGRAASEQPKASGEGE
jgi:RNA polymerase sigma factor (sigma-70 family)